MKKARANTTNDYWDKKLIEAEEKDPNRWRHTGYKKCIFKARAALEKANATPLRPVIPVIRACRLTLDRRRRRHRVTAAHGPRIREVGLVCANRRRCRRRRRRMHVVDHRLRSLWIADR